MKRIRILCRADEEMIFDQPPRWLALYHDTEDGRGRVLFTDIPDHAMQFIDAKHALTFYRQRSKSVPTRDDGQPNCPMTAYTVEIEDAE